MTESQQLGQTMAALSANPTVTVSPLYGYVLVVLVLTVLECGHDHPLLPEKV